MLVATPKKRHSQIHRANLIGVINSAGKYAMRSYYSNFSNWHQKGMHISLNFPSRQDIPPTENGKAIVLYPFIHTCIISIQEGAALSHQGSLIAVVSETMYVRLTPPALWTCLMCGSPPPPSCLRPLPAAEDQGAGPGVLQQAGRGHQVLGRAAVFLSGSKMAFKFHLTAAVRESPKRTHG